MSATFCVRTAEERRGRREGRQGLSPAEPRRRREENRRRMHGNRNKSRQKNAGQKNIPEAGGCGPKPTKKGVMTRKVHFTMKRQAGCPRTRHSQFPCRCRCTPRRFRACRPPFRRKSRAGGECAEAGVREVENLCRQQLRALASDCCGSSADNCDARVGYCEPVHRVGARQFAPAETSRGESREFWISAGRASAAFDRDA